MNVLRSRGILKDILTFYHGAFSFPTFSTIYKSIYKHHLISLPGNVTYKQVRKHLTFSKPIHQRHLSQEPQGLKSTQPSRTIKTESDRYPSKLTLKSPVVCTSPFQATGKLYGYPTGRVIAPPLSGNEYILVVYSCDTNTIHAKTFADRYTQNIISVYDTILKDLTSHGFTLQLLTMNNELSTALKYFIKTETIDI